MAVPATLALTEGLPQVSRVTTTHRGVTLSEMDLDGVLARHPRTGARRRTRAYQRPGVTSREALAGCAGPARGRHRRHHDRQHPAHRVVERRRRDDHRRRAARDASRFRGARGRPDRSSSTSPLSRCATGCPRERSIPTERIDAALSNYFRLGNLTALRELALLWLADEVDSALNDYRAQHGIDSTWQTRERVVVALTGGPEGETLVRRGARIAARSAGGELLAVHVTGQDGLRAGRPDLLATQRTLVESLGGSYHQVVGDDVPRALVEFARGRPRRSS